MNILRQILILLIILVLVNESDEFFWRRRRRSSSRRRRSLLKTITDIGKGIVTGGKAIGEAAIALSKGCCGIHPSVCRHKNELKQRKEQIAKMMTSINSQWNLITKETDWLKSVNDNNGAIYLNIQRITESSTDAIKMLDPNIMVKINDVTNTIKKSIQRHNNTVLQYGIEDIEKELDTTKNKTGSNLNDLEVMGNEFLDTKVRKMTAGMFKLLEISQISKILSTPEGSQLKRAQTQAKNIVNGKKISIGKKELKVIAKKLLTMNPIYQQGKLLYEGVKLLLDGYTKFVDYIKDLATCKKQRSTMETSVRNIRTEQTKISNTLTDLTKERSTLDTNRQTVMAGVKSIKVLKELLLIEEIAILSSSKSSLSSQAASKIKEYREKISSAKTDDIPGLQEKLISALSDITYTVDCYRRKLSTIQTIYRNCKDGLGNYDELYDQALLDFKPDISKCKDDAGFTYTTKSDVMKLIKAKSASDFFEKNCKVNGVKRTLTCEGKNDGFSDIQLAQKYNTDLQTVKIVVKTCASPSISPSIICKLKGNRKSIDSISKIFPFMKRSEITDTFRKCT